MRTTALDTLLESHGIAERRTGHPFEAVTKWYLENAPQGIFSEVRVPEGQDLGTDLEAVCLDGSLHCIQCKDYQSPVPRRDLTGFFDELNLDRYSHGWLFTTSPLDHFALSAIEHHPKPITVVYASEFEDIVLPESLSDMRPIRQELKSPRDYQLAARKAVNRLLSDTARCQLLLAPSTGKTLTSFWIDESRNTKRTLYVVPTLNLIEQVYPIWSAYGAPTTQYLIVCSDESVIERRDAGILVLEAAGVKVTTDAAEVARFLRGRGKRIVFSTYHSTPKIAEAYELLHRQPPKFDLAICDEAQVTVGAQKADGSADRRFSTVLSDSKIPVTKRIFMTGTAKFVRQYHKTRASELGFEVSSMDDYELYGEIAYEMSYSTARSLGWVTDFEAYAFAVTEVEVHQLILERGNVLIEGEEADIESVAKVIGFIKLLNEHGPRRVMTCHSNITRAKGFVKLLQIVNAWLPTDQQYRGTIETECVHSDHQNARDRKNIINQLKAGNDTGVFIVAQVHVLAVGIDVPALDCVVFVDPKQARLEASQTIQRVTRIDPANPNKVGLVFICEFLDKSKADPETGFTGSRFETLRSVTLALQLMTEVSSESVDKLDFGLGRRPLTRPSGDPKDAPILKCSDDVDPETVKAIELYLLGRRYDHDAIVKDIQSGKWAQHEIAKRYGCSPALVCLIAKEIGHTWLSPYDDDAIIAALQEEILTPLEIAQKYECPKERVWRIGRKIGYVSNQSLRNAIVADLQARELNSVQIAKKHNCALNRVNRIAKSIGHDWGIARRHRQHYNEAEILEDIRADVLNSTQIARKHDASMKVVQRLAKSIGHQWSRRGTSKFDYASIDADIQAGELRTSSAIARKYGCSEQVVQRRAKVIGHVWDRAKPAEHGTEAAYRRHTRYGEDPCAACTALHPFPVGGEPARCGTDSGYARHRRLGENPCDKCRKAHSDATLTSYHARKNGRVEKP